MNRFKVTLAYDGGAFKGWQRQKGLYTIQGEIEKVLSHLHKCTVVVVGSGRTDAGVHAREQVLHFDSNLTLSDIAWVKALNSLLPSSIKILDVQIAPPQFHARFSAKSRLYHYYLKPSVTILPWQAPYCWSLKHPIKDIGKLQKMACLLVGTHDFTSFTLAKDPSPSKQKTVLKAGFFPWQEGLCFYIQGSSFLWRQVRSTLGTLIEYERKGRTLQDFKQLLKSVHKDKLGTTAPAHGLFLEKVFYDPFL